MQNQVCAHENAKLNASTMDVGINMTMNGGVDLAAVLGINMPTHGGLEILKKVGATTTTATTTTTTTTTTIKNLGVGVTMIV